jgi:poly-gamma-glutamate synthesis protein (capsule biosynthesis protein)
MKNRISARAGLMPALAFLLALLIIFPAGCQSKNPAVTLALLGDLVLGRGVHPAPGSLEYLLPDLAAADLALANLESPLSPVLPSSNLTYSLCALSDLASLLYKWGFDLVSLSNNHGFDCGPDGPAWTRAALKTAGVTSIGPGMEPIFREIKGLRLAFLAFDDISTPLDENDALQAIHSARLRRALVVVSIHWGAEYQGGASERQESLAQEFASAGAVLIWGHHPHVIQPAKWIQIPGDLGADARSSLVLYSLGNALFDQGGLDETRQSALVVVTLDAHGVTNIWAKPFEINVIGSRIMQPAAGMGEKILHRLSLP